MERAYKALACLLGLLLPLTSNATLFECFRDIPWPTVAANENFAKLLLKPNLGFDVNLHQQRFSNDFGMEHFRSHYPETNFYLGTRFLRYFGLEVGYEHMYRQQKNQFYDNESAVLGFTGGIGAGNEVHTTNVSAQGWHADLIAYLPVYCRMELYGLVGISRSKMDFETLPFKDAFVGFNVISPISWQTRTHSIARLGLGANYMITEHFGARVQGQWENTSKLRANIPITSALLGGGTTAQNDYTARAKNSLVVGLGFFLQAT